MTPEMVCWWWSACGWPIITFIRQITVSRNRGDSQISASGDMACLGSWRLNDSSLLHGRYAGRNGCAAVRVTTSTRAIRPKDDIIIPSMAYGRRIIASQYQSFPGQGQESSIQGQVKGEILPGRVVNGSVGFIIVTSFHVLRKHFRRDSRRFGLPAWAGFYL